MKKQKTPNNQRSNVKNPNNPAYIQDHKNTIKQLQRIFDKTSNQVERQKECQRELSKALQEQQ